MQATRENNDKSSPRRSGKAMSMRKGEATPRILTCRTTTRTLRLNPTHYWVNKVDLFDTIAVEDIKAALVVRHNRVIRDM